MYSAGTGAAFFLFFGRSTSLHTRSSLELNAQIKKQRRAFLTIGTVVVGARATLRPAWAGCPGCCLADAEGCRGAGGGLIFGTEIESGKVFVRREETWFRFRTYNKHRQLRPRRQPSVDQLNPRDRPSPGNGSSRKDPCRFRVSGVVSRNISSSVSRPLDGDSARTKKTRVFQNSKQLQYVLVKSVARRSANARAHRGLRGRTHDAGRLTHMFILDCRSSGRRDSSSVDVLLPYSNIAV